MHDKTIAELSRSLQSGDFSSVELTTHLLDRVESLGPQLNAFVTVTGELALEQAAKADQRRAAGDAGPLNGIPIVHKDLFCTDGVLTSCASRILDNFISPYDATVVGKLKQAGTVMLGKTNMDEFAMGSSNENSCFGPVKNPWDDTRVPGGSSGGSAAAVAARLLPGATGTDTGGSIRQPAALTGITGLKPTYGRVSRYGMVAFASSLDQAGTLTRSAEDAAMMLGTMAGFDPRDSTSAEKDVPDYRATLDDSLDGLRIGVPTEFFDDGLMPANKTAVEAAIRELEKLGAKISQIHLPNLGLSVPTYYVVAPAECSSNLSRFDGVRFGHRAEKYADLTDMYKKTRGQGFGAEVKRRIMIGTYVLSTGYYDAYYLKAQKVRQLIAADYAAAFKSVDLIAGPTTPTPAFELGAKTDDPITMYLNDIYTIGANLAGLPGMSVPCGFVDGLPVGLQIVGSHFSEARLLNVAHRYQQVTDWHTRAPEMAAGGTART
ncbi:MAG: Asp-tRNA(Asn)/Glu-tRNA(Gln) amidotransferase subunit GatA [Proteobacteria bacterium]|nr:Asp-tRNA(Asn)/Glu-tRNA(Gln) amidotransferase subunit GatA [Pseudomonadota bacterium]MCH8220543.1 Asp-tRNA(Asn)/Glu-tRNA(Gln) amidotransferase subunit GatA [Pseudomonadota bacterium]